MRLDEIAAVLLALLDDARVTHLGPERIDGGMILPYTFFVSGQAQHGFSFFSPSCPAAGLFDLSHGIYLTVRFLRF